MKKQNKKGICVWAIMSLFAPFIALAIVQINRSGIIGFSIDVPLFSMFGFGLLAIVFGIIALVKIKKNTGIKGKWLAILGLILGISLLIFLFSMLAGLGQTEPVPLME